MYNRLAKHSNENDTELVIKVLLNEKQYLQSIKIIEVMFQRNYPIKLSSLTNVIDTLGNKQIFCFVRLTFVYFFTQFLKPSYISLDTRTWKYLWMVFSGSFLSICQQGHSNDAQQGIDNVFKSCEKLFPHTSKVFTRFKQLLAFENTLQFFVVLDVKKREHSKLFVVRC